MDFGREAQLNALRCELLGLEDRTHNNKAFSKYTMMPLAKALQAGKSKL